MQHVDKSIPYITSEVRTIYQCQSWDIGPGIRSTPRVLRAPCSVLRAPCSVLRAPCSMSAECRSIKGYCVNLYIAEHMPMKCRSILSTDHRALSPTLRLFTNPRATDVANAWGAANAWQRSGLGAALGTRPTANGRDT